MSGIPPGRSDSRRTGAIGPRVIRAWRDLPHERRLAAAAAFGLFITLFLPWYQETVIASGVTSLRAVTESLTGWGAFSFVEAAVLLVAVGVLVLLFMRADGHAFHVPGGDGGVITAAGAWSVALIVWRMFDKEGTTGHGQYATTSGIEWGIFFALGIAALLTYAGSRIRAAHEPEPPLPGERGARSGPRLRLFRRSRGAQRPSGGPTPSSSPPAATEPRTAADRSARRREARSQAPAESDRDAGTSELGFEGWGRRPGPGPETALHPGRPHPEDVSPADTEVFRGPAADTEVMRGAGAPPDEPPAPRPRRPRSIGDAPGPERTGGSHSDPVGHEPRSAPEAATGDEPRSAPEAPTAPHRPASDPGEAGPRPGPGPGPEASARRGLDPREIQELDLAEPPTARLSRSKPPPRPSPSDDDQLTIRLDRPN